MSSARGYKDPNDLASSLEVQGTQSLGTPEPRDSGKLRREATITQCETHSFSVAARGLGKSEKGARTLPWRVMKSEF